MAARSMGTKKPLGGRGIVGVPEEAGAGLKISSASSGGSAPASSDASIEERRENNEGWLVS